MGQYKLLIPPVHGERIILKNDQLQVPDQPIIPFIEGDGTGPDIWHASQRVFDSAVQIAFQGKKKIIWFEVFAGLKSIQKYGIETVLSDDTLAAISEFKVAIKGPLTTPVGGFPYVCLACSKEQGTEGEPRPKKCVNCGSEWVTPRFRSLNVALRQKLDLYACIRPVRWYKGVPSPVKHPELLDIVIFRENTEDVYAGIEFELGTPDAKQVYEFLTQKMGKKFREDSGIGIKPISVSGTQRLVRKAIQYALAHHRKTVTLVHKGNIQKFTEGAFRDWGYQLAVKEFRDKIVTEKELWDQFGGKLPDGKILINDRIADQMFQQLLLRPNEYEVVATPNLNGDYISDAAAAQVGGLGIAPGANIGDSAAVFEATHGTAPKYTGQDRVNPGSVILSGVMMLEHLGWQPAADLIVQALEKTIAQKRVTYDFERQMEGAKILKTSEFASAIIENMQS